MKNKNWIMTGMALCALIGATRIHALEADAAKAETPAADREKALKTLMTAALDKSEDFFEAYDAARDAGVGKAQLLEAQALKLLKAGDVDGLKLLAPKLDAHKNEIIVGPEQTFASRAQLEGFLHALAAVKAYQEDDIAVFETEVKQALWNAPKFSEIFQLTSLIHEFRQNEVIQTAMEKIVLPMDMEIPKTDGGTTTLGLMAMGNKAVLLDFWASWCRPCMALMPELQKKAEKLPSQGVFVAAINTDDEDAVAKAKKIRENLEMDMPWYIEPDQRPLSRQLLINSIPRMVLITPEGKVLFNGHPADKKLVNELNKLGVEL